MSTITLVMDKEKKTQYKEYQNFLENYKNGRREESDNEGCSLNSSGRTSSSSINTDLSELPTKSFNEYLQNYNNRKFQPVRPKLNTSDEKPKNIKTEVFIQVNNSKNVAELTNSHRHVDEIAKVFEKSTVLTEKPQFNQVKKSFKVNQNIVRLNSNEINEIKPIRSALHAEDYAKKINNENLKTENTQEIKIHNHSENPARKIVTLSNIPDTNTLPPKPQTPVSKSSAIITPSPPKPETVHTKENPSEVPPPPPPPPFPSYNAAPIPPSPAPKTIPVKIASKVTIAKATTLPRMPKNGETLQSDNVDSGINKNDPRVKRAVYGALRNMYGAYHDKANDYLATLPKNRVKKANGLDRIINSIASQGGLEKLSGRAKVEAD